MLQTAKFGQSSLVMKKWNKPAAGQSETEKYFEWMNNKREVSKTRLAYKSDSSEATGTCYNLMSRNSDWREKLS